MKSRGFTLIELLVVISVIGFLSTIILAALSGARQKGQVASVQVFTNANYHTIGTNLLAWYGFDDGWPGNITADLSGNNNSAQVGGGLPAPISASPSYAGNAGNAVYFQGSGNDLKFFPVFPAKATGITVSMWIKMVTLASGGGSLFYDCPASGSCINSIFGTGSGITITLGRGSNTCAVGSANEDGSTNSGSQNICDGNWHNITYTSGNNSSQIEVNVIYVDGKQDSSMTGTISMFAAGTLCGGCMGSSFPMVGDVRGIASVGKYYLDDYMIYGQALPFSGIISLYNAGAAKHGLALK